ncbi:MAG TPA: hypothetical protein VHU23_06470 [Rhizomicrobium sp.]|jgi:photosystem II stability/assembly factor-like uncharacterized protein|nr:hypothetical protein [Rhizomicrobium sp.]
MKTIPHGGRAFPFAVSLATFALLGASAHAATTRYVSARLPMNGPSQEAGAVRPAGLSPDKHKLTPKGQPSNTWTQLANLPGATVHDVAFSSPTTGYAAAELGQIWQTTDGGTTWKEILNRSFPYYYYGIAVNGKKIVATGFDDNNSEAILTESTDGGVTWKPDVVLSDNAWGGRVRFVHGLKDGLAMSGEGLANPNAAWWRAKPSQWAQVTPDADGGWFGYQFTLLRDKTAYASGIQYCTSADIGASWSCGPPADSVFDGPTQFVSDKAGWTGGGEISPDVEGWLHRTTDGGATWSDRVLTTAWPIRQIEFLDKKVGWAAGGNIYSNVGGIYYSADGGQTWSQDLATTDEVGACASQNLGTGRTQIWCIGDAFNGSSFSSNVYSTTVKTPK